MEETAVGIIERETVTEVAISGPMTIQQVDQLRLGLLKAFDLGKKVQISLAAVTEVDVTGLQLLCSAHRTSIVRGLDFSVFGSENKILALVAKQAGMRRHIGCSEDVCGTCVWRSDSSIGQVLL